ncbi:MAG: DUF971 domain-containing protein [Deferribacteres bacterium]|nr:DUF971 domain-containing protein [candidate division KSB1 bacterium]MCB9511580.1 DUF971 domain-containing protein [Deferribacteres bacterium]
MAADKLMPVEMKKIDDETLGITWSDGHESRYVMRILRASCPCAECVDEITGKRIISLDDVPKHIQAVEARPVGRYAYQIVWSDRHDTGIFTYKYLRALCGCVECSAAREENKDQ